MTIARKVLVPPIKSQGIKTKLVPWIRCLVPGDFHGRWLEPFMGTGVVGFNVAAGDALLRDTNPHTIAFYASISQGETTAPKVREYLAIEGLKLREIGQDHYYAIRKRFNEQHAPLDFLFLNRAGFNGMIRFNRKGDFNIPFCRKPDRFAQAYVTKIANQVQATSDLFQGRRFNLAVQDFETTILEAREGDIVYCDPPYIARHADYYNGWGDEDERRLYDLLKSTGAKFILSTWAGNEHRRNPYLDELWDEFEIVTREHFYHVGGNLDNRKPMTEALVHSPDLSFTDIVKLPVGETQAALF